MVKVYNGVTEQYDVEQVDGNYVLNHESRDSEFPVVERRSINVTYFKSPGSDYLDGRTEAPLPFQLENICGRDTLELNTIGDLDLVRREKTKRNYSPEECSSLDELGIKYEFIECLPDDVEISIPLKSLRHKLASKVNSFRESSSSIILVVTEDCHVLLIEIPNNQKNLFSNLVIPVTDITEQFLPDVIVSVEDIYDPCILRTENGSLILVDNNHITSRRITNNDDRNYIMWLRSDKPTKLPRRLIQNIYFVNLELPISVQKVIGDEVRDQLVILTTDGELLIDGLIHSTSKACVPSLHVIDFRVLFTDNFNDELYVIIAKDNQDYFYELAWIDSFRKCRETRLDIPPEYQFKPRLYTNVKSARN